jgi:hypothetical protein
LKYQETTKLYRKVLDRFNGKIGMRLAAGGAPIALKRSAVNQSTK